MFRCNSLCISLCPLPPGLSLDTTEKTLTLSLLLLIRHLFTCTDKMHTHTSCNLSPPGQTTSLLSVSSQKARVGHSPADMVSPVPSRAEGPSPLTCCKCPSQCHARGLLARFVSQVPWWLTACCPARPQGPLLHSQPFNPQLILAHG